MEQDLESIDNPDFYDEDYANRLDKPEEVKTEEPDDDNQQDDDTEKEGESADEIDAITEYLRSKGIDANSVKMENEDGEIEEVNFNDLSKEEQLQLLQYNPAQQEEPELSEDEETLLTVLRQNKMSVQDYLNAYRKHVIEQYIEETNQQPKEVFSVDDYTDEELFIADLKDKIPDLTEEDAMKALEQENQNPELFQKKVAGLRADYQNRERAMREQEEAQLREAQEKQAAQFESVIVDTIQKNSSIDLGDTSLELSQDDMNEIASFILDSDAAGVRHIAKALNDPRTLVEMAWWALKGHDALNQVTQYYKKQIAEARKSARTSAPLTKPKPTTVVTKPKRNESRSYVNEQDLYDNLI